MTSSIKIIANNKKAKHDYHLQDFLEVGMELTGSEVKSLRNGACNLKDSFVTVDRGELFLNKAHISEYKYSNYNNHSPERKRKLLAHREEINKLEKKIQQKGFTLVPTKIYFKNGICKLEVALGKGKKRHDKRDSIKKRDVNRELSRALKKSR
tara:strand:- start:18319 stop:18777 length:459 start_codon:yes stop_codon:yes gene_type:complete